MDILLKMNVKVICISSDKRYQFNNGKEAYKELHGKYEIVHVSSKDDAIYVELIPVKENDEWKDEYKKQFGEEPSFF